MARKQHEAYRAYDAALAEVAAAEEAAAPGKRAALDAAVAAFQEAGRIHDRQRASLWREAARRAGVDIGDAVEPMLIRQLVADQLDPLPSDERGL